MEKKIVVEDREAALLKKVQIKEEEIEKSLRNLSAESERQLAEERKKAEQTLLKAHQTIEAEVEKAKESRRKDTAVQVEKILSESRREANLIHQQAEKNVNETIELIVSHIFPTLKEASRVPLEATS